MMGGVEGPATLLDRASMGVMADPTALRLPPSLDMSGNAGRQETVRHIRVLDPWDPSVVFHDGCSFLLGEIA